MFFGCNVSGVNSLNAVPKCISMNNQECKIRPEIININSNELLFYPYSINVNKWIGSWNSINDTYSKLRVPDVVKNMNIKVVNLMSRTNETRHTKWHETCKYKCRLDEVFVIISNVGIMINAAVNGKNWLTKEYVKKDLFRI